MFARAEIAAAVAAAPMAVMVAEALAGMLAQGSVTVEVIKTVGVAASARTREELKRRVVTRTNEREESRGMV